MLEPNWKIDGGGGGDEGVAAAEAGLDVVNGDSRKEENSHPGDWLFRLFGRTGRVEAGWLNVNL